MTRAGSAGELLAAKPLLGYQASEAMHPLGRICDLDDVAGLAAFLLTTDPEWIAGRVIAVDGGLSGIKLPRAAGHDMRIMSR